MRPSPARPDHFLALAVPAATVRPLFAAAHAALAAHDARLTVHAVDCEAAHVTLGVVALAGPDAGAERRGRGDTTPSAPPPAPTIDPDRLNRVQQAMAAAGAAIGGALELTVQPTPRVFGGGRVLWLPVAPDDTLATAATAVEQALREAGLLGGDQPEPASVADRWGGRRPRPPSRYTPHVTLAKVAWPRRGVIPDAAFTGCLDGEDAPPPFAAASLQLCAMGRRRQGEYYEIVHEVAL